MGPFEPGENLDPGDIQSPAERADAAIVITEPLGETPHGWRYRATQGSTNLLLTVFDETVVLQEDIRQRLERGLTRASAIAHRNLLPAYGWRHIGERIVVAREDPRCTTIRELVHKRMARGRTIELGTACKLAVQTIDAVAALHHVMVHGYISADTVYVNTSGRIFVSAAGEGAAVPFGPRFTRFVQAGLVVAGRELTSPPHEAVIATDVLGVAVLLLEMVTGVTPDTSGAPISDFNFDPAHPLYPLLQAAVSEDPGRRPQDLALVRRELVTASRMHTQDRKMPPPAPAPVVMPQPEYGSHAGVPMPVARNADAPYTPAPGGHAQYPPPAYGAPPPMPPPMPPPGPMANYPGTQYGLPAQSYPPPPPPSAEPYRPPPPPTGNYPMAHAEPGSQAGVPPPIRPAGTPPPLPPRSAEPPPPPPGGVLPEISGGDEGAAIAAGLQAYAEGKPSFSGARRSTSAPQSARTSGADWSKLDQATKSLLEATDVSEVTDSIAPDDDGPTGAPRPDQSMSELGLDLSADGVGMRLEMLDGEHDEIDDVQVSGFVPVDDSHGPPAVDVAREAAIADPKVPGKPEAEFVVTRQGVDQGPYTMGALEKMADRGELRSFDHVTDRREGVAKLAVDLPELRVRFEAKVRKENERKEIEALRVRKDTGSAPPVGRSGSAASTLGWVAVVLAAFGAVAWWLWQQNGGGG